MMALQLIVDHKLYWAPFNHQSFQVEVQLNGFIDEACLVFYLWRNLLISPHSCACALWTETDKDALQIFETRLPVPKGKRTEFCNELDQVRLQTQPSLSALNVIRRMQCNQLMQSVYFNKLKYRYDMSAHQSVTLWILCNVHTIAKIKIAVN